MTQDEALHEVKTKPVVDIGVAAQALGFSQSRGYQMVNEGTIPTIRLSKRRRVVPTAKLLAMLGLESLPEPQDAA